MPSLLSLFHRTGPGLPRFAALLLAFGLLLSTAGAHAAGTPDKRPAADLFKAAGALFEGAEKRIVDAETGRVKVDDQSLQDLRNQLQDQTHAFTPLITDLNTEKQGVTSEMEALGPPPEDKSTEAKDVATVRQRLAAQAAQIDAEIKQAQLLRVQAQSLAQRVSSVLRVRFANQLFSRAPLPLNPGTWTLAAQELDEQSSGLGKSVATAQSVNWSDPGVQSTIRKLAATLIVGLMLVWPVRRWLNRRLLPSWSDDRDLGFSERVWVAGRRAVIRLVPFALSLGMVNAVIFSASILSPSNAQVFGVLSGALVGFIVNSSLVWAAFSPTKPGWRVVPLPDKSARSVSHLITALLLILILDAVLSVALTLYDVSVEAASVTLFAVTVALMVPLLLLCRARPWHDDMDSRLVGYSRWLRWPVSATAIAAFIAGAVGYVEFGHYLVTNLVQTLVVSAIAVVVYVVLRELLNSALRRTGVFTADTPEQAADEDHARGDAMVRFWVNVLIGSAVIIPASIVLLLIWGVGQEALESAWRLFVDGITIGGINLSVINLFSALVVFAVLLFATRLVKNVLETRVLPMTRLDIGLQHSFSTSVGYIGTVVAVLGAASTLGFGLSNLAIVAGALSVGIGFGLQTIVNNFVSGLILLFERPIKVGDRVVAGGAEGYVRKIKVRATEIETFDRSTVIIPNSALITAPVTNWFLNNRFGRGVINIGVDYTADPEQVREILLDCARAHPRVIQSPASPSAFLMNFGDSALEFSLRFQLEDVEVATSAASEIRINILKRLRAENIGIPFPQREVRVLNEGDKAL